MFFITLTAQSSFARNEIVTTSTIIVAHKSILNFKLVEIYKKKKQISSGTSNIFHEGLEAHIGDTLSEFSQKPKKINKCSVTHFSAGNIDLLKKLKVDISAINNGQTCVEKINFVLLQTATSFEFVCIEYEIDSVNVGATDFFGQQKFNLLIPGSWVQ